MVKFLSPNLLVDVKEIHWEKRTFGIIVLSSRYILRHIKTFFYFNFCEAQISDLLLPQFPVCLQWWIWRVYSNHVSAANATLLLVTISPYSWFSTLFSICIFFSIFLMSFPNATNMRDLILQKAGNPTVYNFPVISVYQNVKITFQSRKIKRKSAAPQMTHTICAILTFHLNQSHPLQHVDYIMMKNRAHKFLI